MSHRDEIVRTALTAIRNGTSIEQALTNAVDSAIETTGVNRALQEHVDLRRIVGPEEIGDIAYKVGNRRNPAPPPEPTGKHPTSPWWGRGDK